MDERKKLPLGIENFEKIRRDGFYYVDKTKMIEQFLEQWGEATLFTRPRRFGKSLNMSMLRSFFEIGTDKKLFEGLYISQNRKLCQEYMGKFPVVFISLKGVNAKSYKEAAALLTEVINEEADRHQILLESEKLSKIDKGRFEKLLEENMSEKVLTSSLRRLTGLLEKQYGEKVVVLIDEYDVPLAKANENGYYDEMVFLLRNMFESVLKTNDSLKFAVLTGCLRIAKESIFTGLNNFRVYAVTDWDFDEYFGFTDEEVKEILHYYGQDIHYETVKEWYDGYQFGKAFVYCPWDVLNYCDSHRSNPVLPPANYWLNTSGNDVLEHFIDGAGEKKKLTKSELERLINGETVQKEIRQNLTYKELYSSMENLWSTLLMTGYLTYRGKPDGNRYDLMVPNQEIRNIITNHILNRFKNEIQNDGQMVNEFCNALYEGKAGQVEHVFNAYLRKTISIRDTFVQKPTKENFYHGILLGVLGFKDGWSVSSNKESGDGFSDILIQIDDADTGIVIEVKYAEGGQEEKMCQKALEQMNKKHYAQSLRQAGIHKILKYGIVCNGKRCKVVLEKEK